ncbi:MAG TPA: type II toxin-antitoxin system HicB family antitoxin [Leptolyngbyaceae cyanobacterium]
MTSDNLDLDPIQALTLEAFSTALAQLDPISALPTELREEINQVGEALANQQTDVVDCLENIARKHQPLYELYETAYEALDEQYPQERNKLVGSPSRSDNSAIVEPVDKILQILRANNPVEEAKKLSQTEQAQTEEYQRSEVQFGASDSQAISRTFTAILYREEDVYVAECPEVGTASQGETVEEALSNLKEATELYLEEFPIPKTSPRLITTFSVEHNKADESVEDLIELVDEWMNEDSSYDEEVYPRIDAALKQNRVSI